MKPGEIIQERYQIDHILAQGETGGTYKALDLKTHHTVVIKVLSLSQMQTWKSLEMFDCEANILQQLNHPRIPAYIDHFTVAMSSEVQFVMVQEYIAGKTLHQCVEEGWRGTEAEILQIVRDVTQILTYLHSLDPPVIHRDLTPKHLILSAANDVYLIGFGSVAEIMFTTALGGTMNFGMNGYVPFEQFSGRAVPASDYYALGATLLYLLSHQQPTDFPSEKMKPQFQPYLHASAPTLRLLEGLLEPSAEQRIASEEQVNAILADTSETCDLTMKDSSKPSGWFRNNEPKIEKIVKGDDLFRVCITARDRETTKRWFISSFLVVFGFAAFLYGNIRLGTNYAPFALIFGLYSLICGVLGLRASGLRVFEQTILTLTPAWVHMNFKMFKGKTVWHIPEWWQQNSNNKRISEDSWYLPTAAVRHSGFVWFWSAEKKRLWSTQRKHSYVGINYCGETLSLYTPLSEAQSKALVKELNDYAADAEHQHVSPEQIGDFLKETGNTDQDLKEASKGSKRGLHRRTRIDKILRERNHVRFQLLDKERNRLMLHMGMILVVFALSIGTLFLMMPELRGPKTPSLKNLALLWIMILAFFSCPGSILAFAVKGAQLMYKRTNRTFLDLTPDWIEITCKGMMYKNSWRMPTASFQASPCIIWDFESNEPSGLIVTINHAGITYYFFNLRRTEHIALSEQKAQELIQELNQTLLEMKAA